MNFLALEIRLIPFILFFLVEQHNMITVIFMLHSLCFNFPFPFQLLIHIQNFQNSTFEYCTAKYTYLNFRRKASLWLDFTLPSLTQSFNVASVFSKSLILIDFNREENKANNLAIGTEHLSSLSLV